MQGETSGSKIQGETSGPKMQGQTSQTGQRGRIHEPDLQGQLNKPDMREPACPACAQRHKKRSPEDQKALLTRLRKAEGQIRGIEKMVENDAYCPDILIQVSAVTSALGSFNKELLACHIRSCVAEDLRKGREESVDELVRVLQKLMR